MKTKIKKLWKKIEKKIVNILNKKITISAVIWVIIGLLIINIVVNIVGPKYNYIDMENQHGTSRECYETNNELRCITSIRVRQYYKK